MNNKSRKILILEDDDAINKLICSILRNQGYQVFSAPDAKRAFNIAKKEKPQLICLDICLPAESGFDFCRWVRNEESLSDTLLMVISAKNTLDDQARFAEFNIKDTVLKPFRNEVLIKKVKKVFLNLNLKKKSIPLKHSLDEKKQSTANEKSVA